jgi:hypothetical protein
MAEPRFNSKNKATQPDENSAKLANILECEDLRVLQHSNCQYALRLGGPAGKAQTQCLGQAVIRQSGATSTTTAKTRLQNTINLSTISGIDENIELE